MAKKRIPADFARKLGKRLRELRKKAKLTLKELAEKIAPDAPGYYVLLHRLETGKIKNPTVITVANYLTACNATFNELSDLLNQSAQVKSQAVTKDQVQLMTENLAEPLKTEIRQIDQRLSKTLPGQSVNQRLERVQRMIKNRLFRIRLEDTLYRFITAPEAKDYQPEELAELCRYGRKIFNIYLGTHNQEDRRRQLLARARNRLAEEHRALAGIDLIEQEIKNLYLEVANQGLITADLSRLLLISELKSLPLAAPIRAEKRLALEKQRAEIEQARRIAGTAAVIFNKINQELKVENLDYQTRLWAIEFTRQLTATALQFESDLQEQQRQLYCLLLNARYPDLARRLFELFEKTYPRYRQLALPEKNLDFNG